MAAFTDPTVVAGLTPIKAVHFTELRSRIDAVRARYGLGPYPYTNASTVPSVSALAAVDILEMRTALAEAYIDAGLTPPIYLTSPGPGVAIVVADIADLRSNVVAIE